MQSEYRSGTAAFQARLVEDFEYGLAWSAVALAVFYLGLASVLFRARGKLLGALCEAFVGEGVVFATLAVPFAFEGLVTSAFWALEGAAIVWVGVRQNRLAPRLFGAALQVLAGLAFLADGGAHGDVPLANAHFLGTTLVALAALASSLYLSRGRDTLGSSEALIGWLLFGYMTTGRPARFLIGSELRESEERHDEHASGASRQQ